MDDIPSPLRLRRPRLLDELRAAMRQRNLAYSTERTYLYWIKAYIRFHGRRHPREMGDSEVDAFLSWLAIERRVAPGTQSIALNALVFLYAKFLEQPLGDLSFSRPKQRRRPPQVLTHAEALAVLDRLQLPTKLMAGLMYGSGLRLMETCRLRVKDVDFGMHELLVRSGKGNKDRRTVLPASLLPALRAQVEEVRRLHRYDLARGLGEVYMPYALARKYPHAASSTDWQFLFPADRVAVDPSSGVERRHHVHASSIQRHADVTTTEIYTHVLNRSRRGVLSPMDG